jgi:hypothetical protein
MKSGLRKEFIINADFFSRFRTYAVEPKNSPISQKSRTPGKIDALARSPKPPFSNQLSKS